MKTLYTRKSIQYEKEYTQRRISDIDKKIEELKKNRRSCEETIIYLDKKIVELEEYEKTPIAERTLYRSIYKDSGTVAVMDCFEEINECGFRKYYRMIFTNPFYYNDDYDFNLVVERNAKNKSVGNITMTEFKQGFTNSLIKHAKNEIDNILAKDSSILKDEEFLEFETPYYLRAQNSSNRTGYGNIYEGDYLVREGTLYGETKSYFFTGVKLINKELEKERIAKRNRKWREESRIREITHKEEEIVKIINACLEEKYSFIELQRVQVREKNFGWYSVEAYFSFKDSRSVESNEIKKYMYDICGYFEKKKVSFSFDVNYFWITENDIQMVMCSCISKNLY